MKKIFIIAGEASGDALGAKLMRAILAQTHEPIAFLGVGGNKMQAMGLQSLFPMQELSLLGFAEIIPHIPHLLKRIRETVAFIEQQKPDVVISIDAPAFNFRVAKMLHECNNTIPRVHYVAPSVWAYKPKRAKKMARYFDHVLALLPFEPPYFEAAGLPCTFVGHPIIEESITGGDGMTFRAQHTIPRGVPLLCLMPGSRQSEIKRLVPVFKETLHLLHESVHDLWAVVVSTPENHALLEKLFEDEHVHHVPTIIVSSTEEKRDCFAACDAALVKSGTSTLEVAMAGVPMVVTYKVNPLSAWLLRRVIQVHYVTIVNLLLDAPVIPELLQNDCNPTYLAATLMTLLTDKKRRQDQLLNTQKALMMLGSSIPPTPSQNAARVVLDLLNVPTQTADT